MSAENSRLTRAIQRIASQDPDVRRAIEATKPRGGQPGGTGVGESDGERDRICCDGSTNESANPGTSERDTSEGGQSGLDPNDPANLESGPGELSGVVDCATGQPVCLDGDDWIPPEGWEDSKTGPEIAGWKEGEYWAYSFEQTGDINASISGVAFSCQQARSIGLSFFDGCCNPISTLEGINCSNINNSGNMSCGLGCEVSGRGRWSFSRALCSDNYSAEGCVDSPPRETAWPSDGCVNLVIKNGSIVGSKYDPENDGSYSAPRKEIELCDPETGDSILIRPSSSGGWKSIQSLQGEPDGAVDYGYLYASNGDRIRQISPSEFRDDTV